MFVEPADGRLRASGAQVGFAAEPYRLVFALETSDDYITERLRVEAEVAGGRRDLELRRGAPPLVDDVLDCDLGFSPLFNSLPVLRHDLHRTRGAHALRMAFVDVPSLEVTISEQLYENVHADGVVRYRAGEFVADIEFDADGYVQKYPGLARRVEP